MQHHCTAERASIENSELVVEEQRRQQDRPVPRNKAHSILPWLIKGHNGHLVSETSDLHQARGRHHCLDKRCWSLGPSLVVGNRGPPLAARLSPQQPVG